MIVWKKENTVIVLCTILAVVTAALYWPITGHDFINFDDHQYILENPHVSLGLTWSGFVWSFQSGYAANWHPLTWLSHMVDCEIFGLNPGGHHLGNLLFHTLNSILVFRLLNLMTGSIWRSFFVAAIFGWHPVHVESVAWASERKDVLSGLFWILTLIAYVRYAARPSPAKYLLCLCLFALGLMSKPMLVTLPFVLLLLDFWPLGRIRMDESRPINEFLPAASESINVFFRRSPVQLVLEKIPFFLLSLGASALTYVAQNSAGAVRSWVELPLGVRCANAVVSYWRYIGKTIWPTDLALIYPYHRNWPVVLVVAAAVLLLMVSLLFILLARRCPYLVVGWFWFLGTLVPTVGIVQVGSQAMADRYMYIPGIGLSMMIIWGAAALATFRPTGRKWMAGLGSAALIGCMICSAIQLRYWRNSEALFTHVIGVTQNNYVAYECLGKIMGDLGKNDVALGLYQEAVKIEPRDPLAQYNLGTTLIHFGRTEEAIAHFSRAVKIDPRMAEAHFNWGKALLDQGKINEATAHFSEAHQLQPENGQISCSLGTVFLKQGSNVEAVLRFGDALRLKPEYTEAMENLKAAVQNLGGPDPARVALLGSLGGKSADPLTSFSLGLIWLQQDRAEEAEKSFADAVRLKPDEAGYHYYLATALIRQHKSTDAIKHFKETLRLQPDNLDALNGVAWISASDPRSDVRAGREAVRLAERACGLTQNKQASFLITLAATYAETGRFSKAIATIRTAHDRARADGEEEAVARAETLEKLFESGHTVAEALGARPSPN